MSATMTPFLVPNPPPEPIKRLRVDQYHAIIRAGILDDDDPVELLEGWLVEKMPKDPPHSVVTGLTYDAVLPLLGKGWHIISQEPITTDDSEPEPDIAIVRGQRRDYLDTHPQPKDLALIMEVADTTLARDRGLKNTVYARAGIPTYWIINLVDRCIEVYSDPTGPSELSSYRRKEIFGPKDSIPVVLAGKTIGRIKAKVLLP